MKDEYSKEFGKRLQAIREAKGLNQDEVAEKSNGLFTGNVLSNYERGTTVIPVRIIPTLCKIYNLTPNKLLGWKEKSHGRESEMAEDIRRINNFTNEIAMKYEEDDLLIAASGAEDFDEDEMEKLRRDIERVKNLE